MKTNIPAKITSFLLVILVFFLYGCRNYIVPEEGALSLESARINFPKENVSEALWKGKHLDINYSISQNSDEVEISGTVNIHNSVLMSFDKIEQLVVKFNFLDNSGRVLGTADITPRYATYDKVEGPLDFKNVVSTVPGASSFAFSYLGTLFGRLNESSDTSEIFQFPFE